MILYEIQNQLRQLSELVDSWSAAGVVEPIERDLALDKLKALYEAVRWEDILQATPCEPPMHSIVEPIVDINLDEVFAIGAEVGDLTQSAGESNAELAVSPIPHSSDTFDGQRFAEDMDAATVSESEPEFESLSEPVSESDMVGEEPAAQLGQVSVMDDFEIVQTKELLETDGVGAGAESAANASQTATQPFTPSLFGQEEVPMTRHRSKQRVLMSLYDDEPHSSVLSSSLREKPYSVDSAQQVVLDGVSSVGASDSVPLPSVLPDIDAASTWQALPTSTLLDSDAVEEHLTPQSSREAAQEMPDDVMELVVIEEIDRSGDAQSDEATGGRAVLGDVINHDVHTLADTLVVPRNPVSGLAHSEGIVDLRHAIGINDRFLLIRDLFGGDAQAYDRAIEAIDSFEDFDDCMIHIAENYVWNASSDGAKLLMELLERKLL